MKKNTVKKLVNNPHYIMSDKELEELNAILEEEALNDSFIQGNNMANSSIIQENNITPPDEIEVVTVDTIPVKEIQAFPSEEDEVIEPFKTNKQKVKLNKNKVNKHNITLEEV